MIDRDNTGGRHKGEETGTELTKVNEETTTEIGGLATIGSVSEADEAVNRPIHRFMHQTIEVKKHLLN